MNRALLVLSVCIEACAPTTGGSTSGTPLPDASVSTEIDAGVDAGPSLVTVTAQPRAQCTAETLVGRVDIEDASGMVNVTAQLFDKPPPWIGAPALEDAVCAFHDGTGATGCTCAMGEVCSHDGACTAAQQAVADLQLILRAGDDEQQLTEADASGMLSGAVTLAGDAFSVELRSATRRILFPVTTLPAPLQGASAMLMGTYDMPTGLDVTWTAAAPDTFVFTHVPMNHHVGTPSFTECSIEGSAGAMHISGPLLQPLSVATGLEFQGISHGRIAAAETPEGCVELRFFRRLYVFP